MVEGECIYEGQPIICKEIIEENWLEYLAYVKKRQLEEEERGLKRQKALAELEPTNAQYPIGALNMVAKEQVDYPRYYDLGINQFWSWYITNKIGE